MAVHVGVRGPGHMSRTGGFYPDATLALGFTQGLFRVGAGNTGSSDFASLPGLTVTRASTGYAERVDGTLVQFASGVARITDKGLLVEEARTNVCIRSQEFNTWTATNATVTADEAVAPDGTTTGDLITSTGGSNAAVSRNVTISTGSTVTVSIVAKQSGSRKWFRFLCFQDDFGGAASAYFDVALGVVGTSNVNGPKLSALSTSITALANGWYRCAITFTTASMTTLPTFVYASAATDGGTPATGDAVRIWGAQVEAGAFATSYIPTTSASATRAADQISIALTGPTVGTLYAVGVPLATTRSILAGLYLNGAGGASDITLDTNSSQSRGYVEDAGSLQALITAAQAATVKAAIRFATNNFNAAFNGVAGTPDVAGTVPSLDRLGLGYLGLASPVGANAYIQRAQLYPTADADALMAARTAA